MIDRVKIGPIDYEVLLAHRVPGDTSKVLDPGSYAAPGESAIVYGEIWYGDARIYIEDEQSVQQKKATLMHELVHGVLWTAGQYEANDSEGLVNGIAYGIFALLKDNHHLIEYLLDVKVYPVVNKDEPPVS